jgi:hypothetical protein
MFVDKVKITFHHGSSYAPEGITKKPFATLVINEIVNRELIDKICQLVRDDMNEMGDFCNIKIQSEDWDC